MLAPLVREQYLKPLKKAPDLPLYLYRTIISQQLSTKAGDTIYGRFLELFANTPPAPEEVLAMPVEKLRGAGLSAAKAAYIRNVAQFHLDHGLSHRRFGRMSDEAAVAYLTQIKGIGRWTAEIFLIAALGREDVFPADDLILRKALATLYGIDTGDRRSMLGSMIAVAEKWRPFRSHASRCLWLWDGN